MQFLTPLFLAGLAAVAVPLWFHLIRKEHTTRVPFSSLMYVPPKELELVRRRHLRQWPLFLLRLFLIAFVVLAFSRPYWTQLSGGWSSASLARVVLLDNSFSMRTADRWEVAKETAEREIASAPSGSEITLALVSDRVEILSEPGEPTASLIAKLKRAEPTYRATRLDQGIQVAGDLLKQSRMGTREIVLVSDFQKSGLHVASWSIPKGVGLRTFAVPEAGANLFVEDVQAPAAVYEKAQLGDLVARVRNSGNADAPDSAVELRVEDRVVQSQSVTIPAKGAASVHFSPPDLKDQAIVRLALHLSARDSLPEDNWFFFTMRRQQKVPVVLTATGSALLFLTEALTPPGAIWDLQSDATGEALKKARVLILHDPAQIAANVAAWVQDGGGLLIFSGSRAGESLKSSLLPVKTMGNRIARRDRDEALRFADVQWQHPVFQIFADQQKRYFSTIQFYGYTEGAASSESKVLARFNSESPALVEGRVGRGTVLWFASTVSNEWNDFALRPAFLPFLQQIVAYLAGVQSHVSLPRVGERLDLTSWGGDEVVALDPKGRRLAVPEDRPLLDLELPGFYEVRYSRRSDYAAVNIPASESSLETEAIKEIQARAGSTRAVAAQLSAASLEHGQSWWRILLLAVVVAMLAEWMLADLYYGSSRQLSKSS